jgi:hypothetical protein
MVRVTEHFLNCVAFLCVEERGQVRPKGTAFAVSVPDRGQAGVAYRYLITARHNLEAAGTSRIFVRINTEERFRDILTDRTEWQMHDSADIAAVLFEEESLGCIPLSAFVGADRPCHLTFSETGRMCRHRVVFCGFIFSTARPRSKPSHCPLWNCVTDANRTCCTDSRGWN